MLNLKKLSVFDYMLGMLAVLLAYNAGASGYEKILIHVGAIVFIGVLADYLLKAVLLGKGYVSKRTVITSLIVSILTSPGGFVEPLAAVILAMLSKNILVYEKRHVFNPANFGVLAAALILPVAQSWWAAEPAWLVLLLGLIVAYKLNRWVVPAAFLASYGIFGILFSPSVLSSTPIFSLYSGLTLFFALVMVSEPMTMPLRRNARFIFGALVGLFAAALLYFLPAVAVLGALALGNLLVPVLNKYVK